MLHWNLLALRDSFVDGVRDECQDFGVYGFKRIPTDGLFSFTAKAIVRYRVVVDFVTYARYNLA